VRVRVEIGAFVAHGLAPASARRCADSFAAELTRLIEEQPVEPGAVPPLTLPRGVTTAAGIGAAAAHQLHAAWAR
jgi:hypothetical protein